ncbi:hypothetical protein H8E52_03065 [bacterium]|nr:hypothetical protein [bacterium]
MLLATLAQARETTYVYPPGSHTLGFDRIGDWEMKLFLGFTASYDNPQGLAAVKLKSQDDPDDKKDDVWLTLFGVNSGKGQIVYNPSRFEVTTFGKRGEGKNRFQNPLGIAANTDGHVAVADAGNRRVVFLHMNGAGLKWIFVVDKVESNFIPTDLDWGGGHFWATDYSGNRILRFGPQGENPEQWPLQVEDLEKPRGITLIVPGDDWSRSGRFGLLVVDHDGRRINLFDENGALQARREVKDILGQEGKFIYPVSDLYGNIVLADSLSGKLVKLDKKLHTLVVMDTLDEDPVSLKHPRGLALWRRYGQLFVVEEKGGAYLWTGTDIFHPRLDWEKHRSGDQALMLQFFLSEASLVSLYSVIDGQEVELRSERRRGNGNVRQWILKDQRVEGASEIIIRARPTYSSKKTLVVEERLKIPEGGP